MTDKQRRQQREGQPPVSDRLISGACGAEQVCGAEQECGHTADEHPPRRHRRSPVGILHPQSDDASEEQPPVSDRLISVTPPRTVKRPSQERLDRIHRRLMNDPMWQRDEDEQQP